VLAAGALAGCTALREIPLQELGARPDRKDVRIQTREGLVYEFDFAHIAGDSLTGYRRRDTEGPIPEYATLSIALDDIAKLSARELDWVRTGLIGGGVAAVGIVGGLASRGSGGGGGSGAGGGKPPGP